jgi:ABC-type multidrug transport system ATPase subunit
VLEVVGLDRRFGEREVLRDLRLRLAAGERLAVTGPNGSGKTTLLRCISGTLTPRRAGSRSAASRPAPSGPRRLIGVYRHRSAPSTFASQVETICPFSPRCATAVSGEPGAR